MTSMISPHEIGATDFLAPYGHSPHSKIEADVFADALGKGVVLFESLKDLPERDFEVSGFSHHVLSLTSRPRRKRKNPRCFEAGTAGAGA
jgi:hypothetical protein